MKKKSIYPKSLTDWDRADKLPDAEINMSDNPEISPEMIAKSNEFEIMCLTNTVN